MKPEKTASKSISTLTHHGGKGSKSISTSSHTAGRVQKAFLPPITTAGRVQKAFLAPRTRQEGFKKYFYLPAHGGDSSKSFRTGFFTPNHRRNNSENKQNLPV